MWLKLELVFRDSATATPTPTRTPTPLPLFKLPTSLCFFSLPPPTSLSRQAESYTMMHGPQLARPFWPPCPSMRSALFRHLPKPTVQPVANTSTPRPWPGMWIVPQVVQSRRLPVVVSQGACSSLRFGESACREDQAPAPAAEGGGVMSCPSET